MSGISPDRMYMSAIHAAEDLYSLSPASRDHIDSVVSSTAQKILAEGGAPARGTDAQILALAQRIETRLATQGMGPADVDHDIVYQAAADFLGQHPYVVEAPPPIALKRASTAPAELGRAESVSATVPVPDAPPAAPYTILGHNFRPAEELMEMTEVFPTQTTPIRDLCVVNPNRLVLHEMVGHLVLNTVVEEPTDTVIATRSKELSREFLAANPTFEEDMRAYRDEQEHLVRDSFAGRGSLSPEARTLVEKFSRETASVKGGGTLTPHDHAAIAKRVADQLYARHAQRQIEAFLPRSTLFASLPKIPPQNAATRALLMVNGGIASGKGSSEETIQGAMRARGIEWRDIAKLNTDSYKQTLLDPADLPPEMAHFYSGLVHDEASMIRNRVYEQYMQRMEADTAPHMYFDQVWTQKEILEMGGRTPNGIDVYMVQIPVESSVGMAYSRGVSTRRFETTQGILGTHQRVPIQLQESVQYATSRGARNFRLHFMANVGRGVPAQEVATMDFGRRTETIPPVGTPERGHLEGFYKKTLIDTKARAPDQIYARISDDPDAAAAEATRQRLGVLHEALIAA
jgi:hypothetical protein